MMRYLIYSIREVLILNTEGTAATICFTVFTDQTPTREVRCVDVNSRLA